MNKESKFRYFIEIELPALIAEGVNSCFSIDTDPEVSWDVFRYGLKEIKKRHKELYTEYGETDADEEVPQSEISKWREEQSLKNSYNKSIEGFEDVLPDGF